VETALSPADRAFREEVRSFLDEKFTPELRAWSAKQSGTFAAPELARQWHTILFNRGWIAPVWPVEYGGPGWTPVQRYIFDTECAIAGTPALPAMGLRMCGPVVMRYGTAEQKAFFLPRILSGEHYWCQGYSEPDSGSDLVSLKTRAVRDGADYVVDGTKIWTTHAHVANWIFLLIRTDPTAKPQAGITFLLAPMDLNGMSVRPILSMSGEHEVNQVFFDQVRVPVDNRLGAENEGWSVAKYLLEYERGGGSAAMRLKASLRKIRRIAEREANGAGETVWDNTDFRLRFAQMQTEVMALDGMEQNVVAGLSVGRGPGDASASTLKLIVSTLGQSINRLALEAIGYYAMPDQRKVLELRFNETIVGPDDAVAVTARYLNNRAATIFGGSSEVQRNILARVALGL
jgi:alkylation response protein AidB-like acyl-CoA dehydrogenase